MFRTRQLRLRLLRRKITVKKNKTAKITVKVTAQNKKKATTDTVKVTIPKSKKKYLTYKSAKVSKGKVVVSLKAKKKKVSKVTCNNQSRKQESKGNC